jgi:hypothetical protein
MSSYLARLKSEKRLHDELPKLPKGQKRPDSVLPKPPKAHFDSFDSGPCRRFQKNDEADPGTLHRLIDEALHEIDQVRPDWTGWRRSLTPEQRDRLRDLEAEIDLAALAGDRRRLERALASYQDEIN